MKNRELKYQLLWVTITFVLLDTVDTMEESIRTTLSMVTNDVDKEYQSLLNNAHVIIDNYDLSVKNMRSDSIQAAVKAELAIRDIL